jgi:hypothetical protein
MTPRTRLDLSACSTYPGAKTVAARLVDATPTDRFASRPGPAFFRSQAKAILAAHLLAASASRSPLARAADWLEDGDCGRVSTALAKLDTKDAATALWAVRRCWELDYASHAQVIATALRALDGSEPSEPVSDPLSTAA